jgi:predicted transcriptional regulator
MKRLGSKYLRKSSSSIRRGTVGPKNAKQLFFYVTNPRQDIQGYADFIERITGDAKDLWETLGHESLLNSYDEYQGFLQGRKKATFVRFKNLKELPKPVTKKAMTQIIGVERLPQMGMYVTKSMARQLIDAGGIET